MEESSINGHFGDVHSAIVVAPAAQLDGVEGGFVKFYSRRDVPEEQVRGEIGRFAGIVHTPGEQLSKGGPILHVFDMVLNHINLTVTNAVETQEFLVKYFGMKPMGKPNSKMAFLTDENGMILSMFTAPN